MSLKRLLSKQSAIQASLLLVMFSVLSKSLGLGREVIIAHKLGSSAEYDLYLVVVMLPTAITTAIIYTLSKAVIPYVQQARVEYGDHQAEIYARRILIAGSLLFIALWGVAVVWAAPIVGHLLPGASAQALGTAAQLFRLLGMMPLLFFWHTTVGAFLQAERLFLVSSVDIVLLNTALISTLLLTERAGAWTLAWGWVLGLTAQVIWVMVFYFGNRPRIGLRQMLNASLPRQYYTGVLLAVAQIAIIELGSASSWTIVDRYLAQHFALPVGSISSINYAIILYGVPLSIFNTGLGRAIFPFLSAHVVAGNTHRSRALLERGFRASFLILIPVWLFFIVFSNELVTVLYRRGAFDVQAAATTALALKWLVNALLLDGLYIISSSYLYATRRFRVLFLSIIGSLIVKGISSYLLVQWMGYQGLLVSSFFGALVRIVLIFSLAPLSIEVLSLIRLFVSTLGCGLLAIVAVFFSFGKMTAFDGSFWPQLAGLLVSGATFIALYVAALYVLGVSEVTQALYWLRHKLMARSS